MLLILYRLVLEGDSDRQFLKLTVIINEALDTNCVEFAALSQIVVSLGLGQDFLSLLSRRLMLE